MGVHEGPMYSELCKPSEALVPSSAAETGAPTTLEKFPWAF